MRDRDLERRIRQVLADLAVLSDVPAAQIGATPRSSERELPRGVNPSVKRPGGPPPKDRSLADYYTWQFAHAQNDQTRRVLLYLAEGDLAARQRAAPVDRTALGQSRGATSGEQRDQRIIAWYVGVHPLEAAILESTHGGYCSEENVKQVRRKARRDQETGAPLQGWAGWSDEERLKRHNRARLEDKGLDKMAQEFGVAKSSLQRFVERMRKKAA